VVVQGEGKETLRLFGIPYSVTRVRAAMFNAAVTWTPICSTTRNARIINFVS
jgi:hypothetical protein